MATHSNSNSNNDKLNTVRHINLSFGFLFGALAFTLGYLSTLVIVIFSRFEPPLWFSVWADPEQHAPQLAGLVYYNAHMIELEAVARTGSETVNILAHDIGIPSILFYVIPVISLLIFSYLITRITNSDTLEKSVIAGSSIMVGYLPFVLLGLILFNVDAGLGIEFTPKIGASVFIAGILYPIFFGAIGGYFSKVM